MGQSSTIMQIFMPMADRRKICVSWQKIHIFHYRGLLWGLPSHVIHFWKALVKPMLRTIWHVKMRLTVFKISAVKIWDFGAPWWYPQGETLCLGPISAIINSSLLKNCSLKAGINEYRTHQNYNNIKLHIARLNRETNKRKHKQKQKSCRPSCKISRRSVSPSPIYL